MSIAIAVGSFFAEKIIEKHGEINLKTTKK
jgi:hypothetical protein